MSDLEEKVCVCLCVRYMLACLLTHVPLQKGFTVSISQGQEMCSEIAFVTMMPACLSSSAMGLSRTGLLVRSN